MERIYIFLTAYRNPPGWEAPVNTAMSVIDGKCRRTLIFCLCRTANCALPRQAEKSAVFTPITVNTQVLTTTDCQYRPIGRPGNLSAAVFIKEKAYINFGG